MTPPQPNEQRDQFVNLRLSPALFLQTRARAMKDGESMQTVIRAALRTYLEVL